MRPLRKAVFDIIHHFPPFINITFHFFQKGALQPLNLCYNVRVPIRKGPVAQLGARSVRIREVVGSNPIRSTIRSTVILIELRWIFLLLLSDVPVGTAVFTERKWSSLRPASWCRPPQPGKYRRMLLLPSAKPPEAVRHRTHRLRRLFLCKPYSAAFRLLSHFQLRTSGRSTPLSRIY